MSRVVKYIPGICRNQQNLSRSHTYAYTKVGNLWPMCDYGWNRSDGDAFSIFRGHTSKRGHCRICTRRTEQKLPPITHPRKHRTKWL